MKRIRGFYKKHKLSGRVLEEILEGHKPPAVKERAEEGMTKKRPEPEPVTLVAPPPPPQKPNGFTLIPQAELPKRVKEAPILLTERPKITPTEPIISIMPVVPLHPAEIIKSLPIAQPPVVATPTHMPKPLTQITQETHISEQNFQALVNGLLGAVFLEILTSKQTPFRISSEEAKSFLSTQKVDNASIVYDDSKYKCPSCGKQFKERYVLERHLDLHFLRNIDRATSATGKGRFVDSATFASLDANFATNRLIIRKAH